jgi:FdhE protein
MTEDIWLVQHPYLRPMADLHAIVHSIVAEIPIAVIPIPAWDDYLVDFDAGVPLLLSKNAEIDLRPAECALTSCACKLASKHLPGNLGLQSQALATELRTNQNSTRAITWLLDDNSFSTSQPGLLQYLSRTVLAHYLSGLSAAFANWRDEERWLRNYCPTCGSPPAMAQLIGIDEGRQRFLSCGCCATRWRYRRTECPFCERDDHRLVAFSVEGSPLRIDYCTHCGGYLKTYNGEGSETLLLADWSSVHLDIIACDQGLKRLAGSLYQL